MKFGRIIHWDGIKGYGFVEPDDGEQDLFFLADYLRYDTPAVGDRVSFEPREGDRGPRARAVRLVG
ncbi:cold shock domain-containing protein [Lysobacter sp. H21R4]|uniref:cold-shock protein n=1 Tax=Lysobacter sp. H21R4 TaxID=2781021 RepID=UPI0018890C76|nr:cold shock domain-containing protein [Lysobacter sp. H21R4]QOY63561.1 cold shock domain-containing protein [Lysobacter sp. H21R4]